MGNYGDQRSKHPLYGTWRMMIRRCSTPKAVEWPHYGGRGISVCERWQDFWLFVEDVGERPAGMELDRIDNDGNYEPGNVRWVTHSANLSNRRRKPLEGECPQGHPYEVYGERDSRGTRICKECRKKQKRDHMRSKRQREKENT